MTSCGSGLVPIVQLATIPSKQSMIGERYTFPARMLDSVMSVSHFTFRALAEKFRSITVTTAGVISSCYDRYSRRLREDEVSFSSVVIRLTIFSETTVPMCLKATPTHQFKLLSKSSLQVGRR